MGDPRLLQRSAPVVAFGTRELDALLQDRRDPMAALNGAGLAAPQVANPVRICAIWVKDNPRYPYKPNWPLTVLVNPVVEPITDETFLVYEGCLSVPNLRGEVRRFAGVRVTGWDREGKDVDLLVKGLTAGTFQHELDHLDGKVFVDRVEDTRTLTTWADFERHHMAAFVERARAIVAKYGG